VTKKIFARGLLYPDWHIFSARELHHGKCYFPIGETACQSSHIMSLKSKRELLEVVQPRYLKANKTEKQKIFDEFTSVTGYHRKHAIRALKNQVQVQNHPKMRFCRLRENHP